jgi:hypothetical protein
VWTRPPTAATNHVSFPVFLWCERSFFCCVSQLGHRSVDAKQFDTWTLQPPDDAGHDYLFELGLESALVFVEGERAALGLAPAAAAT